MYLSENNNNLSEKKMFFISKPFSKWEQFCSICEKIFIIMSNFYLVEILNELNSVTLETSKIILKMSN